MLNYNPNTFSKIYKTNLGKDIWSFLNKHENIIRMVTASNLQRPALEPLSELLIEEFGNDAQKKGIRNDYIKKMMGHMTKQIMASQNYVKSSRNIKIRFGNLFSFASRYSRKVKTT